MSGYTCPHCAKPIGGWEVACPHCGGAMTPAFAPPPVAQAPVIAAKRKTSAGTWIAAVVVVGLAIAYFNRPGGGAPAGATARPNVVTPTTARPAAPRRPRLGRST